MAASQTDCRTAVIGEQERRVQEVDTPASAAGAKAAFATRLKKEGAGCREIGVSCRRHLRTARSKPGRGAASHEKGRTK